MSRIAVFVDSGYLFAQGSAAVSGEKTSRTSINIDPEKAIAALKAVASAKAPKCEILRIYWYDGAIGGARPTSDQALLAGLDDVKLRLGFVNSHGQQKGVDSLIVTDLIELARLKSISDALLLSGDEDVRVGVQIAQNYGVRVHLLGIHPSRGSQSLQLMQEADTTVEWSGETISSFMTIRPSLNQPAERQLAAESRRGAETGVSKPMEIIEQCVNDFVQQLADTDILAIEAYWMTERGVPSDLDRRLLPTCGQAIGQNLAKSEIKHMRTCFSAAVRMRIDAPKSNKAVE